MQILLGLRLVYSLWLWRSLRNSFHGPPAAASPSWRFVMPPIPPPHSCNFLAKFSLISESSHTTPASRNFKEELSHMWVRKKVGSRLWVLCSPFLSWCIYLSFTCRLRRDHSLAADGQPEIIRKLTLKMHFLFLAASALGSAGTQEPSKPTGHHEIRMSASELLLCSSCTMYCPPLEQLGSLLDTSQSRRENMP